MEGHSCSWSDRIKIVKIATLLKAIYMFNALPIKIPKIFFTELEKSTLKYILKHERLQLARTMLEVSQYLTPNYTSEPQ
jgi:hypothetical protein